MAKTSLFEPPCPTCGAPRYKYGRRFLALLSLVLIEQHQTTPEQTASVYLERIRARWCLDCLFNKYLGKLPLRYVQSIWPLKSRRDYVKRRREWLLSGASEIWKPTKMDLRRVEWAKARYRKQQAKNRKRLIRAIEKKKRRRQKRLAKQARR